MDVLSRDLKVWMRGGVSLARESGNPIVVFNIHERMNFVPRLAGKGLAR